MLSGGFRITVESLYIHSHTHIHTHLISNKRQRPNVPAIVVISIAQTNNTMLGVNKALASPSPSKVPINV